jgi:hypothetical protein
LNNTITVAPAQLITNSSSDSWKDKALIALAAFAIVLLICLLVVCCYVCRKRKRNKTKTQPQMHVSDQHQRVQMFNNPLYTGSGTLTPASPKDHTAVVLQPNRLYDQSFEDVFNEHDKPGARPWPDSPLPLQTTGVTPTSGHGSAAKHVYTEPLPMYSPPPGASDGGSAGLQPLSSAYTEIVSPSLASYAGPPNTSAYTEIVSPSLASHAGPPSTGSVYLEYQPQSLLAQSSAAASSMVRVKEGSVASAYVEYRPSQSSKGPPSNDLQDLVTYEEANFVTPPTEQNARTSAWRTGTDPMDVKASSNAKLLPTELAGYIDIDVVTDLSGTQGSLDLGAYEDYTPEDPVYASSMSAL